MKKVLILMVAVLMCASVAFADNISLYTDCNASSCELAAGFTTTASVVHKFTIGATGSRFKVAGSGIAGTILAFNTPFTPVGNINSDLSLGYGTCLTGTVCLGSIIATLVPGTVDVLAADLFPGILYTDCTFAELPAGGGRAYIAGTGPCPNAVASSTWGQVKALYR